MFEPPVSTPISRMIRRAASRMRLIFLVGQGHGRRDGDTVAGVHAHRIEDSQSEQTMTTLSLRSRMTSSSYSFQPITDSSIRTWLSGSSPVPTSMNCSNSSAIVGNVSAGAAHRKRRADDRRETRLSPGSLAASSRLCAVPLFGTLQTDPLHGLLECFAILGLVDASADAPTA